MGPQQAEPFVFKSKTFVFKSKTFTEVELGLIREIVDSYSHLGRYELAQTIAAVLEWERANGSPKWRECRDLLEKLADDGLVTLPELRNGRPRGSETKVPISADGEPGQELIGSVRDVTPVQLSLVRKEGDRLLWRELVGRYHYLGHKVPFGAQLRYLVRVSKPREAVVGCVQLSSPAWKVAPRDKWIGWDDQTRERSLQKIVNNSRFLILPRVQTQCPPRYVVGNKDRASSWSVQRGPLLRRRATRTAADTAGSSRLTRSIIHGACLTI